MKGVVITYIFRVGLPMLIGGFSMIFGGLLLGNYVAFKIYPDSSIPKKINIGDGGNNKSSVNMGAISYSLPNLRGDSSNSIIINKYNNSKSLFKNKNTKKKFFKKLTFMPLQKRCTFQERNFNEQGKIQPEKMEFNINVFVQVQKKATIIKNNYVDVNEHKDE